MDAILSRVTQSAFNYAIKSGVPIVAGYTFRQCSRLLQQTPKSHQRERIARLYSRLESKINIISPAIDLIEMISARGNTSLEPAARLAKDIRISIQQLGVRLSELVGCEELESMRDRQHRHRECDLSKVIGDMEELIQELDDAIPLISLAITTSGAAVSSSLSSSISPSRLLQASAFLTTADAIFAATSEQHVQVGPVFVVALYMLFTGHSMRPLRDTGVRETTWKEVMHKAQVKLKRVPVHDVLHSPSECNSPKRCAKAKTVRAHNPVTEFTYRIHITEDLDDDRVHTFEEEDVLPESFEGVQLAGIRETLPVHEIAKIFYADTGKILSIQGDSDDHRPVLLLKRDLRAGSSDGISTNQSGCPSPPSPNSHNGSTATLPTEAKGETATPSPTATGPWRLPPDLDPEWLALEVFSSDDDIADDGSGTSDDDEYSSPVVNERDSLLSTLTKLTLQMKSSPMTGKSSPRSIDGTDAVSYPATNQTCVKTSLSLLEMLIKLTALQQFRQESHLAIEDELLNLFLQDSSTTGRGQEKTHRQEIRRQAVQQVGFDPYDESPIKIRAIRKDVDAPSLKLDTQQ